MWGYNCRMEFFLVDPNIVRLPPAETRLLDLQAKPYTDGKRLRVVLELTPFLQRPYLELSLTDATGLVAASASIVEPMAWKLELTLHIRPADPATHSYLLAAVLSYPELGEIDRREINIEIPATTE